MKNKKEKDFLYYTFLILYVLIIIGYLLYKKVFYDFIEIPECITYKLFGIYCPGCGGTRAVLAFFKGDFIKSFYYNPIVLCFFIITLIYIVTHTIARIFKKDNLKIKFYKEFGYLLISVLIINCIIKNILLLCYGIKM